MEWGVRCVTPAQSACL